MAQFTNKYFVMSVIGHGSFGEVYMATRTKDNKQVALKVENVDNNMPRLSYEFKIYKKIHNNIAKSELIRGVPIIYELIETTDYNMLSMELLGTSLEDIFNKQNKTFKLSTVVFLGWQIMNIIDKIHISGVIHRDIKPANFLTGYDNKYHIYLTDFGLSKIYKKNNKHIPQSFGHTIIGTARYSSINMHMGIEPSRRDDLESIGYMLIYFAKGRLPWQGIREKDKYELFKKIGNIKISTSFEKLCDGLPYCFLRYLLYCRALKFTDEPDYEYLKNLFAGVAEQQHMTCEYEWCVK